MYKCIKGFSIEVCDGDGFTIENEYMDINKGSVWTIPEDKDYRLVGGEVRLENDEVGWIEITKEHLEEHFKLISESEEGKLNKEIDRLYSKIKDGTMEQNSTELFTYMWLSELRDRRLEDENISYYRANVYLNKNEMVHFEASSKDKLIENMKNTLSSNRYKDEFISEIIIYSLKEIDRLSYKELLNR